MAFILDAIRCGRAFDCEQCGELGVWKSPRCDGCAGMSVWARGPGGAVDAFRRPPRVDQAWGM
eukprot:3920648-Prymnesium_polylepis.1